MRLPEGNRIHHSPYRKQTTMASCGLALGGGAVLGAAHIGVLRALEEKGIRPDAISGTSIGAFVAGLYSFGISVDELEKIAVNMKWLDISNFKLSRMGILGNERIGKLVLKHVGRRRIEEADRKLAIVSTDLCSGRKVVLREGPLYKAVMASSCLPGVFTPIEWGDALLVDGFLCESVPVTPLRTMDVDTVIAVDLTSNRQLTRPDDLIDVLSNTFDIGFRNLITRHFDENISTLIQPKLSSYNKTNTKQIRDLIREGYESARDRLEASA